MFLGMDTAVASSTTSAGVAVSVTSAEAVGSAANGGGATLLSPASSSTQLNTASGDSAATMEPLRQALQDAVRCDYSTCSAVYLVGLLKR